MDTCDLAQQVATKRQELAQLEAQLHAALLGALEREVDDAKRGLRDAQRGAVDARAALLKALDAHRAWANTISYSSPEREPSVKSKRVASIRAVREVQQAKKRLESAIIALERAKQTKE